MKKNIILLSYNNYFNRIVKKENTLEEYYDYMIGSPLSNINFNPNDGLYTSLTVNIKDKDIPDYLLVVDEDNKIESRWFVIEADKPRSRQCVLALKRDILVDFEDKYINAPAYIEKGFVDKNNPLIFNKEGLGYNEIKTDEKPLYDSTGCGWIVGYMDNKYPEKATMIEGNTSQLVTRSLSTIPFYEQFVNGETVITDKDIICGGPINYNFSSIKFNIAGNYQFDTYQRSEITTNLSTKVSKGSGIINEAYGIGGDDGSYVDNLRRALVQSNKIINTRDNFIKEFKTNVPDLSVLYNNRSSADLEVLKKGFGQVFQGPDGKFYRIEKKNPIYHYYNSLRDIARVDGTTGKDEIINKDLYDQLHGNIDEFNNKYHTVPTEPGSGHEMYLHLYFEGYAIRLVETEDPSKNYNIDIKPSINRLHDAPYKMFTLPYGGKIKVGDDVFDMTKEFAINVATSMMTALQTFCYDIQLLPYCPIGNWFKQENGVNVLDASYDIIDNNYSIIRSTGETPRPVGVIFHPIKSSFTLDIPLEIDVMSFSNVSFKVERETSLYRLCSPNYANFQDFDPFMNRGVDSINVDCTYKPLTPYIKMNINFKGLYGKDYNDGRGLICGGDFSLPIMSDQWLRYQIDNKNYSNIFERETENLETQRGINMVKGAIGAAGAAVGLAGASRIFSMASSVPRNGEWGNVFYDFMEKDEFDTEVMKRAKQMQQHSLNMNTLGVGLGVGAASMANSLIDQTWGHNEAMDMRKDMYNFNLQNIQARPQGLVKTSAFNFNSRIVPFLEYYTCTDVERDGLRNKIKYNGMTINMIGTVKDFINPDEESFIKGDLIRLDEVSDDFKLASEISNELKLGAFIR